MFPSNWHKVERALARANDVLQTLHLTLGRWRRRKDSSRLPAWPRWGDHREVVVQMVNRLREGWLARLRDCLWLLGAFLDNSTVMAKHSFWNHCLNKIKTMLMIVINVFVSLWYTWYVFETGAAVSETSHVSVSPASENETMFLKPFVWNHTEKHPPPLDLCKHILTSSLALQPRHVRHHYPTHSPTDLSKLHNQPIFRSPSCGISC